MLRWLGKMLLFRILPRKLLPILTAIEVVRFLRNARNPGAATGPRAVGPNAIVPRGGRAMPGERAVPGGLGLPSLRASTREPRVVGASGPELPGGHEGGATVPR